MTGRSKTRSIIGLFRSEAVVEPTIVRLKEAGKDTHLSVQGVCFGGKVISIRASDEEIERVQHILSAERSTGVQTLQPEGT